MKRIEFVAPVEAMRGNLSGNQTLLYAENDNPAYEAPNGQQYAKNYATRYIGAKRAANGLKYFAVKQKSSTTLNGLTRNQMGLIGVTAAIRSALMATATWSSITNAFNFIKEQGLLPTGQETFNKWFNANVQQMLRYKRATWSFTQASISFEVHNPYDLTSASALRIKKVIWVKFAPLFSFGGTYNAGFNFKVDGVIFYAPADGGSSISFRDLVTGETLTNPNFIASRSGLTIADSGEAFTLHYLEQIVYNNNVAVLAENEVQADAKYTTAPPME